MLLDTEELDTEELLEMVERLTTMLDTEPSETVEKLDVLIIGAGLSGIAGAYYLQKNSPDRSIT